MLLLEIINDSDNGKKKEKLGLKNIAKNSFRTLLFVDFFFEHNFCLYTKVIINILHTTEKFQFVFKS